MNNYKIVYQQNYAKQIYGKGRLGAQGCMLIMFTFIIQFLWFPVQPSGS